MKRIPFLFCSLPAARGPGCSSPAAKPAGASAGHRPGPDADARHPVRGSTRTSSRRPTPYVDPPASQGGVHPGRRPAHPAYPILGHSRSSSSRKTTSTTTSSTPKVDPRGGRAQAQRRSTPQPARPRRDARRRRRPSPGVTAADFEDLVAAARAGRHPARGGGRHGPARPGHVAGLFRHRRHERRRDPRHRRAARPAWATASCTIWLGDGKGGFTAWPLTFTEDGKPQAALLGRLRRRRRRATSTATASMDVVSPRTAAASSRSSATARAGSAVVRTGLPTRGLLLAGRRAARRQRRRQARHRRLARHPGDRTQAGRGHAAGPRLPVPRRGRAGSSRRTASSAAFYSNSLARLGLRRRRPQGHPDGQPLHGRADAALEERRATARSRRSRSTRSSSTAYHFATAPGHLRQGARCPPSPTRYFMQANVPEPDAGGGHLALRLRERQVGRGTGSGARRMASASITRARDGGPGRRRPGRRRLRRQREPARCGSSSSSRTARFSRSAEKRGAGARLARPVRPAGGPRTATAGSTSCSRRRSARPTPNDAGRLECLPEPAK